MKLLRLVLPLAALLVAPPGLVRAENQAAVQVAAESSDQSDQTDQSDQSAAQPSDNTDAFSQGSAVNGDEQQPAGAAEGGATDENAGTAESTEAAGAEAAKPVVISDFASAVAALSSESYDDKLKAVQFLGGLGDARAAPILQALTEDRLYAAADGALVYVDGQKLRAALDGKEIPGPKPAGLNLISANNRVRGLIQGVLGQLRLLDPDASVRRRAAEAIADQPTAESAAALARALAKETEPATRAAMLTTLARLQVQDADPAKRLAAVRSLADSTDPTVAGVLRHQLEVEKDAAVRAAAEAAIKSIQSRLLWYDIGADLFEGLSLGSILLLAAIGLAITFGVMGVINMAHGEMIMLGAYTAFVVQQLFRALLPPGWIDAYLVVALPVAFLVTALIGIGLERGVIRFLYGRPLETLLATWGISLILQQAVRSIFGPDNQAVSNPSWMTGGVPLGGGFTLTWNRLGIIIFCLAVLGGLAALLRYSAFGLHMRAVAQNRPMAAAMGIRTGRVDAYTFGLGSGIAGVAGVALSQIGNVSPNLGQIYIVDSFMVVVFGGVGSLWGTLMGAASLGIINKFLEPFSGAILGKIFVLVFIILFIQRRPRGLFALKGRALEG